MITIMDIKQQHTRYSVEWFKRLAPVYDLVEIFVASLRKKVAKKVNKQKAKILDVACGTGNQSIAFANHNHRVVGIDLSPDMLRYAKKKVKSNHDIIFVCGDATEISYPDAYFDVSSISFGLHDMPEEIGIMILREMIRTTKPNGQIIIVDYHKPKNKIIAWFGLRMAKLWESKYYDHFMGVGLNYYLDKVGLTAINKETYLLGNVQVVECMNKK